MSPPKTAANLMHETPTITALADVVLHPEFKTGIRTFLPASLTIMAWGFVTGIALMNSGLQLWQALTMSLLVYAGSAQLAALPLMMVNAPVWVILTTAITINLRFVIYSAGLAPYLRHLPPLRRALYGYLTADIVTALFFDRYSATTTHTSQSHTDKEAFLLGASLMSWLAWHIASIAGIVLGSIIPVTWHMEFGGTLALIILTIPLIKNRPAILGVAVAGMLSLLAHDLPLKLGLLVSVIGGVASAIYCESRHAKLQ
jgi:predicted branched-subunit amino acid permease